MIWPLVFNVIMRPINVCKNTMRIRHYICVYVHTSIYEYNYIIIWESAYGYALVLITYMEITYVMVIDEH